MAALQLNHVIHTLQEFGQRNLSQAETARKQHGGKWAL